MLKIAHIENNLMEKFGIPRQSGLAPSSLSTIVFEPEYRNPDALRGLEDFSHIWLIWEFDRKKLESPGFTDDRDANALRPDEPETGKSWSPTVRPPKLGGNTRMGVFATRSPNRPNPIGLSCVKLVSIEDSERGPLITVSGADLMNGTSILDIKPYLPYADSHPEATGGFTDKTYADTPLEIVDPEGVLDTLDSDTCRAIEELLLLDPRPGYHDDPERIYGMRYGNLDIHFTVQYKTITILYISR